MRVCASTAVLRSGWAWPPCSTTTGASSSLCNPPWLATHNLLIRLTWLSSICSRCFGLPDHLFLPSLLLSASLSLSQVALAGHPPRDTCPAELLVRLVPGAHRLLLHHDQGREGSSRYMYRLLVCGLYRPHIYVKAYDSIHHQQLQQQQEARHDGSVAPLSQARLPPP